MERYCQDLPNNILHAPQIPKNLVAKPKRTTLQSFGDKRYSWSKEPLSNSTAIFLAEFSTSVGYIPLNFKVRYVVALGTYDFCHDLLLSFHVEHVALLVCVYVWFHTLMP